MDLSHIDYLVFEFINQGAVTMAALNPLMKLLSEKAEYIFYLALLIYWLTRVHKLREMVVVALFSTGVAFSIGSIISDLFYRDRPFVQYTVHQLIQHSANASFPSNHATGAFVIATTIWLFRKKAGAIWLALASLIAISRVWNGVHFPSDVLVGAVIGIISALLMHQLLIRWSAAHTYVNAGIYLYEKMEKKLMSKKTKKSKNKNTPLRKILFILTIVIGMSILGVGVYAGYIYYKADHAIKNIAAPQNTGQTDPTTDKPSQIDADEDKSPIQPMIILLAGVDSRDGGEGLMNTDVLMLVSFNPQTKSASLLSLPRDLLIKPQSKSIPSRKANFYYAYYYIKDKSAAISNTKSFFSDLFGLPIDHMMVMNFDALRQTVDTLGGLEIDVDMDMKYKDSADGTNIDLRKGLQKLDGQQVLDFVRYRKSNQGTKESSDFARNDRQQKVIKQLIDKLGAFQNISQWGKVIEIIGNNVKSDIPESQLQHWIYSFSKIKPNEINSLQVESQWKSPFVYVKKDSWTDAIAALRDEANISSDIPINSKGVGILNK